MRRGMRMAAVATVLAVAAGGVGVAGAGETPRARAAHGKPWLAPGDVLVHGEIAGRRVVLTQADLAALPQQTQTITFKAGAGVETHTERGPLLSDVLASLQPTFDPAVKNDKLRHFVAATASDGYQAIVAWGEFDPDFEAKPVLLSLEEDGVALTDGPRLVVPGDSRGGRAVTDVDRLLLAAPRLRG